MDHRSGPPPNFSDGNISGEYIMPTYHTSLSYESQTQENQCVDNIKEMTVKEYCVSQLREEKAREEAPQMTLEEYILGKSILQCQDNSPESNAELTRSYLTGKMTRKWVSNISKIQMGAGAQNSDTHSPTHLILDVCERYIAKNILQESHLNDSASNSQLTRWNVTSRTTKKMFPDGSDIRNTIQFNPLDETSSAVQGIIDEDALEDSNRYGSNSSYVDQKVSGSLSEVPNHYAQDSMEFSTDDQYSWTPQSINNRSSEYEFFGMSPGIETTSSTAGARRDNILSIPMGIEEAQCITEETNLEFEKRKKREAQARERKNERARERYKHWPQEKKDCLNKRRAERDKARRRIKNGMNQFEIQFAQRFLQGPDPNSSKGNLPETDKVPFASISFEADQSERSVKEYILQERMKQSPSNSIDESALELGTEGQDSIGLSSSYVDHNFSVSPSTNDQFIYPPHHYAQESMEFDDQYSEEVHNNSWTPQSINKRSVGLGMSPQTEATFSSATTPLYRNSPTTEVVSSQLSNYSDPIAAETMLPMVPNISKEPSATTTTTENEVKKVADKELATKRKAKVPMTAQERSRRNWENKKRKFNSMSIEEQQKIRQRNRECAKRKRDRENKVLSIPIQEATDEDIEEAHNIQMRRAKQEELRIARRAKANLRLEQRREKEGEGAEGQDSIGLNSSNLDQDVSASPSTNDQFIYPPIHYAQESMDFDDQYSEEVHNNSWTPQSINNRSAGLEKSSQTESTVSSAMTPLYRNSPTTEVVSSQLSNYNDPTARETMLPMVPNISKEPSATTTTTENEVKKVAEKVLVTKRKGKVPMTAEERNRRNWENKKRKFNSMSIEEQQKIRQRNRESAKRIREKKLKSMSEEDKRLAREKKNERDRKWRQNMSKEEKDRQRQKRLVHDRANIQKKKEKKENLSRVLPGDTSTNNNKLLLYYLDAAPIL
ncbi:unnamed protein product [Caenorhabditis brenneri]